MELASWTLEFACVPSIFDSFLAVGCMAGGAVMQCLKRSLVQLIFSMDKRRKSKQKYFSVPKWNSSPTCNMF